MRQEFSKSTKLARFDLAKGHCETCGQKILTGAEYDHAVEDYVGGANTLANCRCVCKRCHGQKTQDNRPAIDRTRRIYEKRAGVRDKRRGFKKPPPGYSAWTRSIDR